MKIYLQFNSMEVRDRVTKDLKGSGVPVGIHTTDLSDMRDSFFLRIEVDTSRVYFLVEYQEEKIQITFDEVMFRRHYYEMIFNKSDLYDINFTNQ